MSQKGLQQAASRVRFVQVGESAGKTISLAAARLRSSAIEFLGSGFGSASLDEIFQALAEFFQLAARSSLKINIRRVPLREVEPSGILSNKANDLCFCRNRVRTVGCRSEKLRSNKAYLKPLGATQQNLTARGGHQTTA